MGTLKCKGLIEFEVFKVSRTIYIEMLIISMLFEGSCS